MAEGSSKIYSNPRAAFLRRPPRTFPRFVWYTLKRVFVILTTIVIGVYITVIIANKGGQVDNSVQQGVESIIRLRLIQGWLKDIHYEDRGIYIEPVRAQLEEDAGLNLPPALRNLRWTYNVLSFGWGEVLFAGIRTLPGSYRNMTDAGNIILQHFPNTLLLIGTAELIIFVIGIPLALHIATQKREQWLDRFIAILSPLSSIPSWVHGIILVSIFAVGLRILPFGGKYDTLPPETKIGYIPIIAKHMILPTLSILLGVFFQLVYTWRTYLSIYSEEDYVHLAIAKGLPLKSVERKYILRPTMPYLLTSFALTLVGFWQMTTALEYFFNWPGIGKLYVQSLPNFWGETFFPGEMTIILSIVVIFAYMLGIMVLLFDIIYAWLDPRIRMGGNEQSVRAVPSKRHRRFRLWPKRKTQRKPVIRASYPSRPRISAKIIFSNWLNILRQGFSGLKNVMREIRHYPSAIVGLFIITIFVMGSIYAVIALPYKELGSKWYSKSLTGKLSTSKNALPEWINWFRINDLPTTKIFRSQDSGMNKVVQTLEDEKSNINFSLTFDYPYQTFPQDLILYIDPTYQEKRPHVSITWITPDGREVYPRSPNVKAETAYFFSEYLNVQRFTRENESWQKWFVIEGQNRTPEFYLLFADPAAAQPLALPGTYKLEVSALAFEEDTDVDIELVLLGRVSGWAGTDYLRRDLVVPLLWGLPFALAFGGLGAIVTTILAMIVAAAGVWFGGGIDNLIQRIIEANMILPILAIGILVYALYGVNLWLILGVVILLNVFGNPTKAFRAAFLQVKEAPYIEAARSYGASSARIIFHYMIPKIVPVLIPQLVTLIPSLVFLEATLAIFNVYDPRFPTWGRVIYEAIDQNALYGGYEYWVLEPISLLLMTGLAFSLLGSALERIMNPRLQSH